MNKDYLSNSLKIKDKSGQAISHRKRRVFIQFHVAPETTDVTERQKNPL